MKESLQFNILKLFNILLVIIFVKELRSGIFIGFWKKLKEVFKEYRWLIAFYSIMVVLVMFFIDKPVVEFWQTSAFQKRYFYYPGVIGNLIGNGKYLYSFLIVVILASKVFNKEEVRKKFAIALSTSVIAGLINTLIKTIFRRQRPDIYEPKPFKYKGYMMDFNENIKAIKGDYSLPSGHTMIAVTTFIFLFLSTKNKRLKVLYLILPFITAYGRTYFSKHWVSDVSISFLLGTIFAVTAYRLNYRKNGI